METTTARAVDEQTSDGRACLTGRHSLARRERQTLLGTIDVLLVSVAWSAPSLLSGLSSFPYPAVPLIMTWVVVSWFAGLYEPGRSARVRDTLYAVVNTASVSFVVSLLLYLASPTRVSRAGVFGLGIGIPVVIVLWRLTFIRLLRAANLERMILIVGAGKCGRALMEAVHRNGGQGVRVVAFVDDDPSKLGDSIYGVPILGPTDSTWSLVQQMEIEEVVLAISGTVRNTLSKELERCYENGIDVSLMPHLYEAISGQVPVEHMSPQWVGSVPLCGTGGRLSAIVKRAMDISISGPALVALLPVMAIVGLIVRFSSPGPILFRQVRFGLGGRPFDVVKFRTMYVAGTGPAQPPGATGAHTLITRSGRWLRRLHVDELPQLWLVLKGEMSLVGPRPKRADQAVKLERDLPLYRLRYSVRPGLTGWAQIRYRYAHTPADELTKLRYDVFYVKNHSLLLDIGILVRTVGHVLAMRGS